MAKKLTKPTIPPTHEEIERRAYAIFEERGRPEGCDQEHWFEAESQLTAARQHEAEAGGATAPTPAAPTQSATRRI